MDKTRFLFLISIIVLALIVIGVVFAARQNRENPTSVPDPTPTVILSSSLTDVSPSPSVQKHHGTVLAGSQSFLLDFNEQDYQAAKQSNKVVVLYFYASWCPICREEIKVVEEVFDGLASSDVIGFRVNFNDTDTERAEQELAREFGVAYQHTKVFLKDGQRVLKSPAPWKRDMYLAEINKARGGLNGE